MCESPGVAGGVGGGGSVLELTDTLSENGVACRFGFSRGVNKRSFLCADTNCFYMNCFRITSSNFGTFCITLI